jgi:hypothetical protein
MVTSDAETKLVVKETQRCGILDISPALYSR